MSTVKLLRVPGDDVWHRKDILGCSRTSTLATGEADRRAVPSGEWPDGERCERCTW